MILTSKKTNNVIMAVGAIIAIAGFVLFLAGTSPQQLSVLYGPTATATVGQPVSVLCYEGLGPQAATGAQITYVINWGDGSSATSSGVITATSFTATHVYGTTGNYLAVCSVSISGVSQVGDTNIVVEPVPVTMTTTSNGVATTVTTQVSSTGTIQYTSASTTTVTQTIQKSPPVIHDEKELQFLGISMSAIGLAMLIVPFVISRKVI